MVADCPIRANRIETVAAISVMATSSNGSAISEWNCMAKLLALKAERTRRPRSCAEVRRTGSFPGRASLSWTNSGREIGRHVDPLLDVSICAPSLHSVDVRSVPNSRRGDRRALASRRSIDVAGRAERKERGVRQFHALVDTARAPMIISPSPSSAGSTARRRPKPVRLSGPERRFPSVPSAREAVWRQAG